jgi:hypothetical protein
VTRFPFHSRVDFQNPDSKNHDHDSKLLFFQLQTSNHDHQKSTSLSETGAMELAGAGLASLPPELLSAICTFLCAHCEREHAGIPWPFRADPERQDYDLGNGEAGVQLAACTAAGVAEPLRQPLEPRPCVQVAAGRCTPRPNNISTIARPLPSRPISRYLSEHSYIDLIWGQGL